MMKTFMQLALVGLLVVVAAPSYSSEASQSFTCKLLGEADEDQVVAMAAEWLKAAQSMKGGANIGLHLAFPVAAQMGDADFRMVITLPTFTEYGEFWDNYHGSPASTVDDKYTAAVACPDSRLFEVVKIK